MSAVLSVAGLHVDAGPLPILRDVGFELQPGRVLGLVGESGAGKSTLGRVVAGDLPASLRLRATRLDFAGAKLRPGLLGREIAFIPQEPQSALNPVRTVGSQMAEHLWRLGVRTSRARRATALLEAVHLPDPAALLRRYPHQLSGGQCQRVLIAMAFAGEPRLLVADEPTTALDPTVQARVLAVLREMQAAHGTAVLLITHDLRLAGQACDEVMVLYAGRPAEIGPAAAVLAAPRHPYTRCLLLANPPLQGGRAPYVLPEAAPATEGCRFAPRCPLATPACAAAEPPLRREGATHAACLHAARTPAIAAPPPAALRIATTGAPVVLVEDLAKRYGRVAALQAVSFHVAEGEFVGLVGESGSGKSTVARLLAGLERPSGGQISLAEAEPARAVQMVFQNPQSALNPRRRTGRIVTQALDIRPTGAAARHARALALLRSVGLQPELAARYPFQLSGGQRQRVNIARALCVLPRLLVADEIASGLDVSVQAQLLLLLARLREEMRFAMLFISHDLSVVRALCDRVLVMRAGRIVEEGRTEAVFAAPQHPYTRELLAAVPPDPVLEEL